MLSASVYGPPRMASSRIDHLFIAFDAIQAKVGHRAEQAVATRHSQARREATKLGEKIEHAGWHWPAQGQVAAQLGRSVVGDEEGFRPQRVGGYPLGQKFILPEPSASGRFAIPARPYKWAWDARRPKR